MVERVTAEDLWARMTARMRGLCARIAEEAAALEQTAYLVGGSVRDLFLNARVVDLDVVVEGDAVALAGRLGSRLGGTVHGPSQFMTAAVDLPEGGRLDLATARQERYPEPTKLPVVAPATIADDLRRRDFAVNAIAVRLTPSGAGELVDPCGGRQDLAARLIRVLHDRSFIDDPTRIIRAVRYAERLGFALEAHTRALLGQALEAGGLEGVTGARVREEVVRLLAEPSPGATVRALVALGAAPAVFPGLRSQRRALEWLAQAPTALAALGVGEPAARSWPYLLGALVAHWDARAVVRRLELDGEASAIVGAIAEAAQGELPAEIAGRAGVADVHLDEALGGVAPAALVAYWLRAGGEGRRRLERYARWLRRQSADLDGHDLQEQGVAAGPALGVGLRAGRRAKLRGLDEPAEQLGAALAAVSEWRRPPRARRLRPRHTG